MGTRQKQRAAIRENPARHILGDRGDFWGLHPLGHSRMRPSGGSGPAQPRRLLHNLIFPSHFSPLHTLILLPGPCKPCRSRQGILTTAQIPAPCSRVPFFLPKKHQGFPPQHWEPTQRSKETPGAAEIQQVEPFLGLLQGWQLHPWSSNPCAERDSQSQLNLRGVRANTAPLLTLNFQIRPKPNKNNPNISRKY